MTKDQAMAIRKLVSMLFCICAFGIAPMILEEMKRNLSPKYNAHRTRMKKKALEKIDDQLLK
jgi:hypothetical protein